MNFKISLVSFLLLLSLSLIAFAFSLVGVAGSVIDSIWKVIALCVGLSLIFGFTYPYIRGVKRGDYLSTNAVSYDNHAGATIVNILGGPTAVALQSGRIGSKIKINFQGRQAEGIIVSYASTFSQAMVKITEMEQVPVHFKA
ncbi:MAG: hypothetical protein V1644_00685 [Candidatus Micrarchaeota archaeon]